MLGIEAVPALAFGLLLMTVPESPPLAAYPQP